MIDNRTIILTGRIAIAASLTVFLFGAKPDSNDPSSGGDKTVEGDGKALEGVPAVKVDDVIVTVDVLKKVFAQMSPMQLHDMKDPAKMDEFLTRVVKTELMAKEARRRGYDKDPEVVAIYKNKIASLMHRRIADEADKGEVTEADLRKYYEEHSEDYHKPEKKRARQILIVDKAKAEELLKDIIDRKVKQQEFRKLAKEKTEDEETRKQGGDLGFFTQVSERKEDDPQIDPAVVEAVFALKVNGDVHPKLVKTDKGHHIVMLTGQRKKIDFTFEDSKDRLKVLVKRETRKTSIESSIEKLKERFPVEIYEENLKHVVIELTGKNPSKKKRGSARKSPIPPSPIRKP